MTKKSLFGLMAWLILSSFTQANQPAPFSNLPTNGQVQLFAIQGSNTIGAKLAPELVISYMKAKGATDVEIRNLGQSNEKVIIGTLNQGRTRVLVPISAHGSGTGFKGLKSGTADIAAASRPIKDKEANMLAQMADMRSSASEHVVGIDGLAIVVHPANPMSTLSVSELAGIFSGKITNWSQLGGRPGNIRVYARDENSGTWDTFKSMVLSGEELTSTATRYESNDELSDSVSKDSAGIGFVGLSSVRAAKLLSISDGPAKSMKPNKLTVATEDYALSRRLFMYTDDNPSNQYVTEFMNFVQANEGQRVVAETGFISQELKAVTPESYNEYPQEFQDFTERAKRLTINFRFHEGSARLDNKALRDVERLVGYLKEAGDDNSQVLLIGFGDKKKTERRSELLSKLRAM
ncbi:MAG: substrate-binding domain-containing protein, partial [Oceanobacter sp.]